MSSIATGRFARVGYGVAACALALLGCGGDERAEARRPVGPGRSDAGRSDAGGRALADAGRHDTEIFSGDHYLCGFDDEDTLALDGSSEHAEVAIATDDSSFALVFHDALGSLFIQALPIEGAARAPVRILASGELPASAAIAASAQGFLLTWRGGPSGVALRARELSTTAHGVLELTSALEPSASGGELSALIGQPDGFVVAFLEAADGGRGAPELRVQRLGLDGTPAGAAQVIDGVGARAPEDLHLGRLDRGRALLAWLERDGAGEAHVMGVPLSAELEPEADPTELSRSAVAASRFDLAARELSAGLIYQAMGSGVREAIKYRRVQQDGLANEALVNIVNAPGRALHGSIAPFGQGYAVAYRALPSLGVAAPAIRVAFLNQFGDIVHEAEIAETTQAGGRTTLAATRDGYLLVGWTSEWPSGAATHALKLHCPGALVLCGGQVD